MRHIPEERLNSAVDADGKTVSMHVVQTLRHFRGHCKRMNTAWWTATEVRFQLNVADSMKLPSKENGGALTVRAPGTTPSLKLGLCWGI